MSQSLSKPGGIFEKYALDPSFPIFVAHCSYWKKSLAQKFDAYVDTSKPISYWQGMTEFLSTVPEHTITHGLEDHSYPLFVENVIPTDSKNNLAIQLSDLLASSFNYAATKIHTKKVDQLTEMIRNSKFGKLDAACLWPTEKFTPADLGSTGRGAGPDSLDFIANEIRNTPDALENINSTKS